MPQGLEPGIESVRSLLAATADLRPAMERIWVRGLQGLYPDQSPTDIFARFLAPWRELAEAWPALGAGALTVAPADLPGWLLILPALREASLREPEAGAAQPDATAAIDRLGPALAAWLVRSCTSITLGPRRPPLRVLGAQAAGPGALPATWTRHGDLVGSSQAVAYLVERCRLASRDRFPVLISGETGTGKEVAARLIHELSGVSGRFVPVNCGALPEALVESELFGHVRGAFTGAGTSRSGLIAEAHGGTLLLDEITEVSQAVQVKILRVIQDGLVRPVGSNRLDKVDSKVVATTNRDPSKATDDGSLRRDLFYRLSVHPIRVPPLAERPGDIPELVAAFLERWRRSTGGRRPPVLDQGAVSALKQGPWPGNIRQLEHVVYRLASAHGGGEVGEAQVREVLEFPAEPATGASLPGEGAHALAVVEREAVVRALVATEGNKAAAARILGVTRKTLYHKIRVHGIGDSDLG